MVYAVPAVNESLTQADIIDGCPIFGLEDVGNSLDMSAEPARWQERVIVLTQACDLAQTKTTKVLVALIHPAQSLVDQGIPKAPAIREQVRRGLVYGWYFLPAATVFPLPESIIDLHDLHTVPRIVFERLVTDGKRLGRLLSQYREHLAQHFAVTYMRIGLPAPPNTES